MSLIIKLIGLGFLICLINPILKKHSPQTAAAVTILASVTVFSYILNYFSGIISRLKGMTSLYNISLSHGEVIIKVILIAWICEYCGAIIEDAGEKAVAKKIEFAGKIVIFVIIFPILTELAGNVVALIR